MAVRAAWLTAWCLYLYCVMTPWLWGQHDWLHDVRIFTAWWHHGCEGSMTDCMMSVSLLRDDTMAVRAAWLTEWCLYLYCVMAPWLWGQHDWLHDVRIFTVGQHHGCEGSMTDWMMSVSLLRDGTMAVRAAWLTAWCPYLYRVCPKKNFNCNLTVTTVSVAAALVLVWLTISTAPWLNITGLWLTDCTTSGSTTVTAEWLWLKGDMYEK